MIDKMLFQNDFQIALQNEGMMKDVVKYLSNENDEIKKHCAVIIYKVCLNTIRPNTKNLLI